MLAPIKNRDSHELGRTAAKIPTGMDTIMMIRELTRTSSRVAGAFFTMTSRAGPLKKITAPQVSVDRVFKEADPLDHERIVQPEFFPQGLAFFGGHGNAHQISYRIAHGILDCKSDKTDHYHDQEGLGDSTDGEGEHIFGSCYL